MIPALITLLIAAVTVVVGLVAIQEFKNSESEDRF
jgi:hypothetical protein